MFLQGFRNLPKLPSKPRGLEKWKSRVLSLFGFWVLGREEYSLGKGRTGKYILVISSLGKGKAMENILIYFSKKTLQKYSLGMGRARGQGKAKYSVFCFL